MELRDLTWSASEKKTARAAYDKAYQRELISIKEELEKMIASLDEPRKIWKIHDYLDAKRRETDNKYDYRYSKLIWVFANLWSDGFLTEDDLEGLSEDKIARIKSLAGL